MYLLKNEPTFAVILKKKKFSFIIKIRKTILGGD